MNKILKSYRLKKRWYCDGSNSLKYLILPLKRKVSYIIAGTVKALYKKKNYKSQDKHTS